MGDSGKSASNIQMIPDPFPVFYRLIGAFLLPCVVAVVLIALCLIIERMTR